MRCQDERRPRERLSGITSSAGEIANYESRGNRVPLALSPFFSLPFFPRGKDLRRYRRFHKRVIPPAKARAYIGILPLFTARITSAQL